MASRRIAIAAQTDLHPKSYICSRTAPLDLSNHLDYVDTCYFSILQIRRSLSIPNNHEFKTNRTNRWIRLFAERQNYQNKTTTRQVLKLRRLILDKSTNQSTTSSLSSNLVQPTQPLKLQLAVTCAAVPASNGLTLATFAFPTIKFPRSYFELCPHDMVQQVSLVARHSIVKCLQFSSFKLL